MRPLSTLPPSARPPLTGLVLAGGLARRMGGVEKALVSLHGRPLIAHVIDRLKPQTDEILVNANGPADRFAGYGDRIVPDLVAGRHGPLAGLHAGMASARNAWILAVPCDAPLLPGDLGSRLWQGRVDADAEIAVARADGQVHPVFCLLPAALGQALRQHLAEGGRAVQDWMRSHRLVFVDFEDGSMFTNVNTPDELARLEAQTSLG